MASADISRPSGPSLYEFFLGGSDHRPADEALAAELEAAYPGAGQLARDNRAFTLRAVQWCAVMLGTGLFLELGAGLPSGLPVHDAARKGVTDARVIYVDRDPVVVSHCRAVYAGIGGTGVVAGDVTEPGKVLESAAALGADLTEPAACVLCGTLSSMDAETARSVVAGFAAALAPGSAVIISCATYADPDLSARMSGIYAAAGTFADHDAETVEGFFRAGGLRLSHLARVQDTRCWPLCPVGGLPGAACVVGGIGIKDLAPIGPRNSASRVAFSPAAGSPVSRQAGTTLRTGRRKGGARRSRRAGTVLAAAARACSAATPAA